MSPGSEDEGSDYINASWLTGDDDSGEDDGDEDDINVDRDDDDHSFGQEDGSSFSSY